MVKNVNFSLAFVLLRELAALGVVGQYLAAGLVQFLR